jgi:hypothetical protein
LGASVKARVRHQRRPVEVERHARALRKRQASEYGIN